MEKHFLSDQMMIFILFYKKWIQHCLAECKKKQQEEIIKNWYHPNRCCIFFSVLNLNWLKWNLLYSCDCWVFNCVAFYFHFSSKIYQKTLQTFKDIIMSFKIFNIFKCMINYGCEVEIEVILKAEIIVN